MCVPCRAGLLCLPGRAAVPCRTGLLVVPVGGGPPASRPSRELRSARPISKSGQAPPPPTRTAVSPCISCTPGPSGALHTCLTNLACYSPATISEFELYSLVFQRF